MLSTGLIRYLCYEKNNEHMIMPNLITLNVEYVIFILYLFILVLLVYPPINLFLFMHSGQMEEYEC